MTQSLAGVLKRLEGLPREMLHPGVPPEERNPELQLLETLVPEKLCASDPDVRIRRGCILIHGRVHLCVHILNGSHTEIRAALVESTVTMTVRRNRKEIVTPIPDTAEAFSELIRKLGFGEKT